METIIQDLQYGLRMLIKRPGFTLVAVLALALGIGANTAIFSVIDGVMLKPPPYFEPDRLVRISEANQQFPEMSIAYPNLLDWREQNKVFTGIAGFRLANFNLIGSGEPERLQGREVSGNFFSILGVNPILGRSLVAEDDHVGANRVCLISYNLWQRRFGSDNDLIGKTLRLSDADYTVAGVLPRNFQFGSASDVFVPIGLVDDNKMTMRGDHPGIFAIARLKPGVSRTQALAELVGIQQRLSQQYPETNTGSTATVISLTDFFVGDLKSPLLLLLGAVGLVLLIACANVANLLLARAASRSRELAIRTALGAGRARIIRQLLTESILLSGLGGIVGICLALWGVDLLKSANLTTLPSTADLRLDGRILGFTFLISLLTGVIFGLIPALQASRPDLNEALKEGSRSGSGGLGRQKTRSALVVSEVALSLVLLIGAGLLIRSVSHLRNADPGFKADNLLTMQLSVAAGKNDGPRMANFFKLAQERVSRIPGVVSASYSFGLPFVGAWETSLAFAGQPKPTQGKLPHAVMYITSPDYLKTAGLRLLRGRFFTEQDTRKSQPVVVIDESLAAQYLPGQDPVGQHLLNEDGTVGNEIIGLVGHVRNYGLDDAGPVQGELYYDFNQVPEVFIPNFAGSMSLEVRTASDPLSFSAAIRREIQAIDPNQPVYDINTMGQVLDQSVSNQRFSMLLLTLFAGLALVLAIVGIYGVMSYVVAQRTHEIGIRMALGAQANDVLRLVVGQGMLLVLIGIIIGMAGAAGTSRLLSGMLYGVSRFDPVTFGGVSVLLALVAFLACVAPARRATRVDPIVALHHD